MQIGLGFDAGQFNQGKRVPIIWDTQRLINGHVFLVGKSGTGKTYTLRNIIGQIQKASGGRVRVHVFDVHGDIDIPGASSVQFSEATPYGFNPLVVNPDPHFGGVRKKIQGFLAALDRSGYGMGSKQESVLRNLLVDLYASKGFYQELPASWHAKEASGRVKRHPTVDDAVAFAEAKLKSMYLGTNSKTVEALEKLYRKQGKIRRLLTQTHRVTDKSEIEELQGMIKKEGEEATDLFKEHLDHMVTGQELDDLIKYNNKDVMMSVVERLQNLKSTGIFRPERPPFDTQMPIWRYNIKALETPAKKLFVSFLLEAIYAGAVQRGEQDEVVQLVVLDEAHLFFDDKPDNPIDTISKEARKFGLGMICASQNPLHFSEDFISNVSTKIILGIDQLFWDQTVRKMKVDMEALEWIVPHKKIIIQMNNKGETRNRFLRVATGT